MMSLDNRFLILGRRKLNVGCLEWTGGSEMKPRCGGG